jgi:glucose-6-phosphate isomerase
MSAAWEAIEAHGRALSGRTILDLFAADAERAKRFTFEAPHLLIDFSKEKFDARAQALLADLARAMDFTGWREKLFAGAAINTTENRAVLHTALRGPAPNEAIAREIAAVREKMTAFAAAFRAGKINGATGKPLNAIVHIGIGGSDLGPRVLIDALKDFRAPGLTLRFASNVDGADIADAIEGLGPERTLVAVVSKTFTTLETITNAETARAWLRDRLGQADVSAHFLAISAAPERAIAWGVKRENVFPFWDWVGGRYSLWSAVSLSVAACLHEGAFDELLAGAAEMDEHFRVAPLDKNAPFIAACVHTWNRNALGAHSYSLAPYARRLDLLPSFLQQMEMESNGKSVTRDGAPLTRLAQEVTWGSSGTNGQHSFFQLLQQGVEKIPVEFVIVREGLGGAPAHRLALLSNALAQAEALMVGKSRAAVEEEMRKAGKTDAEIAALAAHHTFSGDRPSTMIALDSLTPKSLGALLAFYEHRTFAQGVLMGVNSFDQWGVELGKQLAGSLSGALSGAGAGPRDPSTQAWIERLRS